MDTTDDETAEIIAYVEPPCLYSDGELGKDCGKRGELRIWLIGRPATTGKRRISDPVYVWGTIMFLTPDVVAPVSTGGSEELPEFVIPTMCIVPPISDKPYIFGLAHIADKAIPFSWYPTDVIQVARLRLEVRVSARHPKARSERGARVKQHVARITVTVPSKAWLETEKLRVEGAGAPAIGLDGDGHPLDTPITACSKGRTEVDKVTVLFLAANPIRSNQLQLDEEIREIQTKIRASDHPKSLELLSRWAVRPDDLLQHLNEVRPHAVHFSGHGAASGELILADHCGEAKPVTSEAIAHMFRVLHDNVRLVVFNACFAESQAKAVVQYIDCAIGPKGRVDDTAAATFAASLYSAIGFSRSVEEAFEQASVALELDGICKENPFTLLHREGVDPRQVRLLSVGPADRAV